MKPLSLFFLLVSCLASAQTTVTGTIVDPNGNPYANGTASAYTVAASGQPSTTISPVITNVVGLFTMTVPANTYVFTICAPPTGLGPTVNPTPVQICFSSSPIAISGGSQDLSAQLSAIAKVIGPKLNSASTTPGGSNGQVQFNNSGTFGGLANVAIGSSLVSQGAGVSPGFQAKPLIDVRDGFGGSGGVDCTGVSDSTAALQGMINNAPDFSTFLFPAGCKVKVSGTTAITIDSRFGLQFYFEGRNGNNCLSGNANPAQLFYNQTYGSGNRVLYINRSQALEFKNLMINVNGGGDIGLDIDQVGATPPITTRNDFYNVCVANQVAPNSNFKGVRVSNTATANVENQHFYHLDVLCSTNTFTSATSNGYAIWFGGSANLKNEIIEDARSSNCSAQIFSQFGSDFTYRDGLGQSFSDIRMGAFNDMLSGYRSEFSDHPVTIVNANGPHLIEHNDFAAITGSVVIDCPSPGCGQVIAIGNETDNATLPWFNPHNGGGSLFATGNRFTNLSPLDWDYSWRFEPSNGGTDLSWISSSTRITPNRTGLGSLNLPSPPLIFESVNGAAHNYDSFIAEVFGEGPLSNTPSSENFSIFYTGTNTNYLTLGSQIVDLQVGPNATTAATINSLSPRGTPGSTTWCYKVVARTLNGHSAVSSAVCDNLGNATLNGTNFEIVLLNAYSGAIAYDIYRTTAGGTPNTTGKIGSVGPKWVNGGGVVQGAISFSDTGLAGDSTVPPATNTTGLSIFNGQIQSTVTTGTAPFIVASTTPVANLTVSNHPQLQDCGTTSTCANTQKTAALIVRGSVAFPTATTVTVTSLPFTSSTSYSCTAGDVTTAAGVINATTYSSGASVTFTETNGVNTDTMRYVCAGF